MHKRIISMFMLLLASITILLSSDLVITGFLYSRLDNLSVTAGYYISKDGGITEEVVQLVKKEENAKIYCATEDCPTPKKGDTYFYIVEKSFTPVIFSSETKAIKIKRSVVIGLYNN